MFSHVPFVTDSVTARISNCPTCDSVELAVGLPAKRWCSPYLGMIKVLCPHLYLQ